jgi:hypothetical protein
MYIYTGPREEPMTDWHMRHTSQIAPRWTALDLAEYIRLMEQAATGTTVNRWSSAGALSGGRIVALNTDSAAGLIEPRDVCSNTYAAAMADAARQAARPRPKAKRRKRPRRHGKRR